MPPLYPPFEINGAMIGGMGAVTSFDRSYTWPAELAAQVENVVDEGLAAGDAEFQQKCFDHLAELKDQGTTIVVFTHSLETLEGFADRVILLDHGRIKDDGDPVTMVGEYMKAHIAGSPANRARFIQSMRKRGLIQEPQTSQELLPATEDLRGRS